MARSLKDYQKSISCKTPNISIARYESDGFSMCSEKISHGEARKMLSESEQRFSAILDSFDQADPDDSFLENELLMQHENSRLGKLKIIDL